MYANNQTANFGLIASIYMSWPFSIDSFVYTPEIAVDNL